MDQLSTRTQRPIQISGGRSRVEETTLVRTCRSAFSRRSLIVQSGIVTSFTLSTHPIHEVWGGVKIYTLDQTPAVLHAMSQYQSNPNKDPYANLITQIFTTNATIGIVLTMVYLKPEVSPPAFKPFYAIPTINDTTKLQTLTQLMGGQNVPPIPR